MASDSNAYSVESQSSWTVPDLISQLTVAMKNREAYLMNKVRDLEDKVNKSSQDNESHALTNQMLNENLLILQMRYDDIKNSNDDEYANKIKHLNSKIEMMGKELNIKQNEIEILRKGKNKGSEIDPARKINLEYKGRMKIMSVKKEALDDDPKNTQSESDAVRIPWSNSIENHAESIGPPPGFKEIVNSKQRSYPKRPKIIEIDDDDNDLTHASLSKRKQGSNVIRKEDNYDECISVSKHASKKVKRECDDDFVDNIPKGTQPVTSHQVAITCSEKVSTFLDTFGSSSVNVTKEKQNERWKSQADMLKEFEKGDELCLNAICALHRQSIKTMHTFLSAHISRAHGISRINQLAHLLIDGDPQQKMKKKSSELYQSDIDDCRRFAKMYSAHLFEIYKKKDDPFFPPSRTEDK
ncbi:hypothetical protein Tco_1194833 [Tanacetum coccineum]